MKKTLLFLLFSVAFSGVYAQGCLEAWKAAFQKRGAYTVSDEMHRKVYIHFEDGPDSYCVAGKARVENGKVVSVFLQYEDGNYELMDQKLTTPSGGAPSISNGISDEIVNEKKEHFYVIFVEKLKPKKKPYKTVGGPDDL